MYRFFKAIAPIDPSTVTTTYNGLTGCACGCGGTYAKSGPGRTRRINQLNRELGRAVATAYPDGTVIAEVSTGNALKGDWYVTNRVTRVYFTVSDHALVGEEITEEEHRRLLDA